jgi:hypothetical protein
MNKQVTEYIIQAPDQQKKIMEIVRQLIHENAGQVQEEFKWSRPVFRKEKDFAYLKTAKAYVTLGFFNFQKLDDPDNLLEGTGKDMRHIKLKSADSIDKDLLKKWIITSAEH